MMVPLDVVLLAEEEDTGQMIRTRSNVPLGEGRLLCDCLTFRNG